MRRFLTTAVGRNQGEYTSLDWILFWGIGLIWGSSFLLIDIGLEALQPGLVTWLRITFGAAVLWSTPAAQRPIDREDGLRVLVMSISWVAVPFTLFPIAQRSINSALSGMLNGAAPIFTAVIASIMLRRLPRGVQQVGLLLGLAGVVAIGLPSSSSSKSEILGVFLVLIASLCYGLSFNLAAPIQQRYGSLPVMARMLAMASLWTLPMGMIGLPGSKFVIGPAIAVLVLGIVQTGLAFVVMATLVGRVGPTRSSFIGYIIPLVALALGVAFRGDDVAAVAVLGICLVTVGAVVSSRREA